MEFVADRRTLAEKIFGGCELGNARGADRFPEFSSSRRLTSATRRSSLPMRGLLFDELGRQSGVLSFQLTGALIPPIPLTA